MTDTCKCPPDDCHGGHTINIGPARPDEDRLRTFVKYGRDAEPDEVTAMAAELLALRPRVAELEAERVRLRNDRMQADARTIAAEARVAELEAAQPKPELLGYLPSITRVGRCLEPGEHISPTETPIPDGVAVWMNGAPSEAGPIVAHAAAVDGGCGWFVDTVELDGSRADADTRCHSWMSDAGYRAVVVELRAVA